MPRRKTFEIVRTPSYAVFRCAMLGCTQIKLYHAVSKRTGQRCNVDATSVRGWAERDGWRVKRGTGWICPLHAPVDKPGQEG